jgi:hypothetical protein
VLRPSQIVLSNQLLACNGLLFSNSFNARSIAPGLHDQIAFVLGFASASFQNRLLVDGMCGLNFDSAKTMPNRSHAAAMLDLCIP